MKKVEQGNFVKICYTGKLETGEIFDQTQDCNALEIEVGAGEVIPGFEKEIVGMELNEKKTFHLSPDEAYGDRDDRLQRTIARENFPAEFEPREGELVAFKTPKGEHLPAMIVDVQGDDITVDFNHPLAGKRLTFEVEIASISDQRAESGSGSSCSSGCCCS